jgi:Zn-finger nucleic acid-binding protein
MECPVDHVKLENVPYEGSVRVDRCPRCQGMWLDEGELEAIENTIYHTTLVEESSIETEELAVAMAKHKADAPLQCPLCAGEMARREYGYCSLVLIDTCPSCMGIWLDGGEVQLLEQFFERLHPHLLKEDATKVAKHHLMAGALRLLT